MTITDYKTYFNSAYKGAVDFDKNILSPILGKVSLSGSSINYALEPDYIDAAAKANIKKITDVGEYSLGGNPIRFFDIALEDNCNLSMARVNIRKVVTRLWKEEFSGFIIVFHYDNPLKETWRFSWVERRTSERNSTPGKRYTYLCGPSYSCRTIAQRFDELQKNSNKTLDSITKAFDVEALSDEFFKEYKVMYDDIVQWITGQRIIKKDGKWKLEGDFGTGQGNYVLEEFKKKISNDEDIVTKAVRDYVKKLMGRLVFIQFLQKKNWLEIDGTPTSNFLLDLFNVIRDRSKENFIEWPLKQVVYLLLNNESRKKGDEEIDKHKLGVPFLNGGLFEPDEYDRLKIQLPKEFFHNPDCQDAKREWERTNILRPNDQLLTQCGMLDLFNHYNFTIDENDPNDAEVGVDPEMLGKIFENLLEDNKEKGAFYTPKEIVQYMCKESLIAYLCSKVPGCDDDIRTFVEDYDRTEVPESEKVLDALRNVKICDPAIGSGAFPMGLLNLLVCLRQKLEPNVSRYDLKKEIIQNNIYGVDIEKGAIDIARLRFWLSIMVDEVKPTPLPNFDYKFMQGNSLLECYNGVELNLMKSVDGSLDFAEAARSDLQKLSRRYFDCKNHTDKIILQKEIENKIKDILELQKYAIDLSGINLSGNDQFFLWHTWFANVFEKGGFDIVIGNPPYIRQEKLAHSYKKLLCSLYPNYGDGTADILVYFFGLGVKILCNNGILNFITSNKFLKTKYGRTIRNTFANDVDITTFIDFFELPVFNNASTDAGIIFLIKRQPESETRYFPVKTLEKLNLTELTNGSFLRVIKNIEEWQFVKNDERSILSKLNNNCIPLYDFVDGRIYRGITTGSNPSFILNKKVRKAILDGCETSDEYERTNNIIKKAFRSRDIRKYNYTGPEQWLLFIPWHFPLPFDEAEKMDPKRAIIESEKKMQSDYPSLYRYLCSHKEDLAGRNQDETGIRYEWYALQRWGAKYYKEFDEEKLIYIHTAKNHEFYYDTEKHYVNNSCYIIVSMSKFLYCFLNSSLFNYFKRIKFVAYGDGAEEGRCKLDGNKMATVPIKTNVDERPFEKKFELLQQAIIANDNNRLISLESEIDHLVYLLYGLTWDEVQVVENSSVHAALPVNEATYSKWLERYQKNGILPSEEEMDKAMGSHCNHGASVAPVTSGPSILKVTYQSPYESFGPNYGLELEYNYDTDDLQCSICGRGDSSKTLTPAQIESIKEYLKDRRNIENFFNKAKSTAPNTSFTHFRSHDMSMEYGDRSKSVSNGELMPWAEPFAKLC